MSTPQNKADVFKQPSISTEMAEMWLISVKEMQDHGFQFITCIDAWLKMSKKKADIMDEVFPKKQSEEARIVAIACDQGHYGTAYCSNCKKTLPEPYYKHKRCPFCKRKFGKTQKISR